MWRAPGYRKSFHSQLQQQRANQKIMYTFAIFPLTRHVTVGDSPVGSIDLFLIKISLIVHVTILLHLLKPYKKDSNVPSTTTTTPPPPCHWSDLAGIPVHSYRNLLNLLGGVVKVKGGEEVQEWKQEKIVG